MIRRIKILIGVLILLCLFPGMASAADNSTVTGEWTYTMLHEVTLTNNTSSAVSDIEVTVPLTDLDFPDYAQKLGEQITPYPDEIVYDGDSRRMGIYHIDSLNPGESISFVLRYALDTYSLVYNTDSAYLDNDAQLDESYIQYLIAESDLQKDDPAIINFAEEAAAGANNQYTMAKQVFAAVNLYLDYADDGGAQDALSVLSRRTANCEGYSNLLVACLRALDIPARQMSGYLFLPNRHMYPPYYDKSRDLVHAESLRHMWAEFYLPGAGWYMADPTFTYTYTMGDETKKYIDWSYFAQVVPERRYIYFRSGSVASDKIQYSSRGGQLTLDLTTDLLFGSQYSTFSDISGHWAEEQIIYATEQGYFTGVGGGKFAPNMNLTRGMFVTLLGRYYELHGGSTDIGKYVQLFTDVKESAYYSSYVNWAAVNGLMDGYGKGVFGPGDAITREQMARILANYLSFLGEDDSCSLENNFTDRTKISSWAIPGVNLCVDRGLITGMPGNIFSPKSSTTRAQTAVVLQRLDALLSAKG